MPGGVDQRTLGQEQTDLRQAKILPAGLGRKGSQKITLEPLCIPSHGGAKHPSWQA